MITPERYEVIKKFGNTLFKFHQKQASPENKEKLKGLLKKMVLTKEFHWSTNPATKAVIVTFWLGKMTITVGKETFFVHIDEQTRENLKKYGKDLKGNNQKTATKTAPTPLHQNKVKLPQPTPPSFNHKNNQNTSSTPVQQKDKYVMAQEEVFRRHKEKEMAVAPSVQESAPQPKTEEPTGKPLFLGFLSDGDYAM